MPVTSNVRHSRRSIRLKEYDYSQTGIYFVTIVTQARVCLFGELVEEKMSLNKYGKIARMEWFRTTVIRSSIQLHPDEFVVMPNHIHGIIWIINPPVGAPVGAQRRCAPTGNSGNSGNSRIIGGATANNVIPGSLGAVVRAFKSITTRRINVLRRRPGDLVWQRNYYEHIIRDDQSLNHIREYIANNPLKWEFDRENPAVGAQRRCAPTGAPTK